MGTLLLKSVDKKRLHDYIKEAEASIKENKYGEAIILLSKVISVKSDPGVEPKIVAEAYEKRGFIYLKQKKYKRAISDFTEAIKIKPTYGLYFSRHEAYMAIGEEEKALQDLYVYRRMIAQVLHKKR